MKQSTKLLSLVLALVMAFSCMTVVGNATFTRDEVVYDSIDDAVLLPEQVADIALDLVDGLLRDADIDDIDLYIATVKLGSIDEALDSIISLRGNILWGVAAGLIGDVGDLNFDPLGKNGDRGNGAVQRSDGDLVVIKNLLNFLGDGTNADILSKAAYGLSGGNGIDLGLIGSFVDLSSISDMISDIPGMLKEMVYDMLIYGSFNPAYENESYPSFEDNGEKLPADMDTLDEMVDNALLNLIINPQDYTWEGEGEDATKDWDEGSVILPSVADWTAANGRDAAISYITPRTNSFFKILDALAQFAINDIAINALNNNLKKTLMEAVEIDLNEIKESDLPAAVATDFEASKDDGTESYVTYLAYDRMIENGGTYYYTTLKNVTQEDANGDPVLDDEGNEISYKERKYYKANMASGNEFASIINWDWEFVGTDVTPKAGQVQLDYNSIIKDYDGDGTKSIVEGINDLLKLVYDVALTDEVKADFEDLVDTGYVGGANSNLMTNVNNIAKYLLANYGELVFGSTSPYAHLDYKTQLKDLDTVDLIAMIGPGFFEDVMPQLIIPKNPDGTYAFHDGVQIYEFGALVLREFASDIAPNVNYDQYIFANGDVTAENDRLLNELGADQWFNLILNMGVDIGYTYLYNLTNFGDVVTFNADGKGFGEDAAFRTDDNSMPALPDLDETEDADSPYKSERWMNMLDDAIIWAARYVGGYTGTSVIDGLDVTTISAINGPLNKLSYILNRLLPLGFVNGYTGGGYDFNVALFLDGLKGLFTDFDLSRILSLLGRNTASSYNFLDDNNLVNAVLTLVNDILGLVFRDGTTTGILQCNARNANTTQSLDTVISQASLKTTIRLILTKLKASQDAILLNGLPVLGKFIKGWGTEQNFSEPVIDIDTTYTVPADGNTWDDGTENCEPVMVSNGFEVAVYNESDGMWRKYVDPATNETNYDQQYEIELTSVDAHSIDGKNSPYVACALKTPTATAGNAATFVINVGTQTHADDANVVGGAGLSNLPNPGASIVRLDVKYKIYDEKGVALLGGKIFTQTVYTYITTIASDEEQRVGAESDKHKMSIYTPIYVPYSTATEYVKNHNIGYVDRDQSLSGSKRCELTVTSTNPNNGFYLSNVSVNMSDSNYGGSGLRLFDTYTADLGNSTTTNISGSVPTQEQFEATVDYDTVATVGASTSWSVHMTSNGGDNSADGTLTLRYYDDINRDKLIDLVNDENDAARLEANYFTSGTVYADRVLKSADEIDDMGTPEDPTDDEVILRETTSTQTAWVDAYGNPVDASAVEVDEDNEETGIYEKDGVPYAVKKVTVLDAADVWSRYTKALEPAMKAAYQTWNSTYSVYNFKELYEPLRIAATEVEYLVNRDSGDNVDNPIADLKVQLAAVEAETTDTHNYTDYRMYRLNRLNDARDDANYYINLKKDASHTTVTEIDEVFPYTGIEEADLRALVAGNPTLAAYTGGTDKKTTGNTANLITALLESMSDEEIVAKTEWLADRKLEYQGVTALDVAMASNYLGLTKDRLLYRGVDKNNEEDVNTKYLEDELISAINMIGDIEESDEAKAEISSRYTARSWAKYEAAYYAGWEVLENPTQKTVFDTKYELMCARNELVLKDDEADYDELEKLIAQAEQVLANTDLYNNTAKELGQVLAELGINEEIEFNGGTINLFPGSAYYVNSEPYSVDDQDEIDDAAEALKEALARLKFKGLTITGAPISTGILVEGDKENDIEEVTATIATIAAEMKADAVKALFNVTANNANVGVDDITVSNDLYYTVETDLDGFAGTNSVVTFYTLQGTVKIPVATIRIVVNGDINGDGAVDVLDGAYAQLVSTEKADLEGCYLIAGDLTGNDREVLAADYAAIVDLIVA